MNPIRPKRFWKGLPPSVAHAARSTQPNSKGAAPPATPPPACPATGEHGGVVKKAPRAQTRFYWAADELGLHTSPSQGVYSWIAWCPPAWPGRRFLGGGALHTRIGAQGPAVRCRRKTSTQPPANKGTGANTKDIYATTSMRRSRKGGSGPGCCPLARAHNKGRRRLYLLHSAKRRGPLRDVCRVHEVATCLAVAPACWRQGCSWKRVLSLPSSSCAHEHAHQFGRCSCLPARMGRKPQPRLCGR
ncbi:MAG: hypothetical protein J3K34DRAFT_85994 [Monoraphidium minutum]|nr:MAG: hypothetical protein J3K34DRAFT_85994 [Monoraphidium minutum]